MCGIQSAESASMGGTIRVLERELAEAQATIVSLIEEVVRLRVLQRAFTWVQAEQEELPMSAHRQDMPEKQSAEMRGHSSTAVGKRTAISQ